MYPFWNTFELPHIHNEPMYPRNMSRKNSETFARTLSQATAMQIRDMPRERQPEEVDPDSFDFRRAVQRAISRLEKEGYVWPSAPSSALQ